MLAASALVMTLLVGCAELPENSIPAAVDPAESMAVEAAASPAIVQVSAYLASTTQLPATLAEAGYVMQEGISVSYLPGSGADFRVCATSGAYAFEGHAGTVTPVATC
jgi:hypothetical protein